MEQPYILWHGINQSRADWSPSSHTLGMEMVHPTRGEHIYVIFNMYWEDLDFELPKPLFGKWHLVADTYMGADENFKISHLIDQKNYLAKDRSIVILTDLSKKKTK